MWDDCGPSRVHDGFQSCRFETGRHRATARLDRTVYGDDIVVDRLLLKTPGRDRKTGSATGPFGQGRRSQDGKFWLASRHRGFVKSFDIPPVPAVRGPQLTSREPDSRTDPLVTSSCTYLLDRVLERPGLARTLAHSSLYSHENHHCTTRFVGVWGNADRRRVDAICATRHSGLLGSCHILPVSPP